MNTFIEQYRAACTTIAENQALLVGLGGGGGEGGGISEAQLCEKTIESISIPASVTMIKSYAFYEQRELKNVYFANDSNLALIGDYAFYGCSSLYSLTLPDSVTMLGTHVFSGCSGLYTVTLPNGITDIRAALFQSSGIRKITIPASVVSIAGAAFSTCNNLKEVTFADGSNLNRIEANAFEYTALRSITLPSTITSIGYNAFYSCSLLTDIYVPWAEGEVEGAPWGATNATIHYNS